MDRMGLKYKWSDFTLTDNSCKTPTESPIELREKYLSNVLITEEQQLQQLLTQLRSSAVNTLVTEEKEAEKSIALLEKDLEKFEREVERSAAALEKSVEGAVKAVVPK